METFKYFAAYVFLLCSNLSIGQTLEFSIHDHHFVVLSTIVKNEWNTKDTLQELYRVENNCKKLLLKFYPYKDEGSDCNNFFWNKEKMTIKNDSLIFITHYFQKTKLDPIPEWRKQIYIVKPNGKLTLLYDKYKYYHSTKWVNK